MHGHPSRAIVVIDDDEGIRELLELFLTEEGYDVTCVKDPNTALDVVHERQPFLILLDLLMPGLSGDEFIAAYRQLPDATASIVVISGRTDVRERAVRAGADGFLGKPFELADLLDAIRAARVVWTEHNAGSPVVDRPSTSALLPSEGCSGIPCPS